MGGGNLILGGWVAFAGGAAGGAAVGQSNGVSADGLKLYAARQVLSKA